MRHHRAWWATAAAGALLAAGCTNSGTATDEEPTAQPPATTQSPEAEETQDDDGDVATPAVTGSFRDGDGGTVGTVELTETDDGTEVRVRVEGLEPGFHGLHVHDIGVCEPDSAAPDDPQDTGDFMSAGPHLNPEDVDHGDHPGDLSPLLVMSDGTAVLTVVTDRFTITDLQDEDGTAFMVHSDPDNLAHVPDRYGGPDEDTLATGDAGERVACAVVE